VGVLTQTTPPEGGDPDPPAVVVELDDILSVLPTDSSSAHDDDYSQIVSSIQMFPLMQ
jgi:hypothetical protein